MQKLTSAVVLLVAASCGPLPGERAGGGGGCPVGETCSGQTPNGLFFEGTLLSGALFDVGDHPTAVGGFQTIRIFRDAERNALRDAFVATVEGDAEVVTSGVGRVVLRGLAEGFFDLRISDTSGALMDHITLEAGEIADADFGPDGLSRLADPQGSQDPLYFENAEIAVVLALSSETGSRLIDEDATAAIGTQLEWDFYGSVTVDDAPVEVVAGGATFNPALETTDVVETIELLGDSLVLASGDQRQICFRARTGTRAVLGASWQFSGGGATISIEPAFSDSCVEIIAEQPGQTTLVVDAAQARVQFPVTVVSSAVGSGGPRDEYPTRPPPLAGERARQALDAAVDAVVSQ